MSRHLAGPILAFASAIFACVPADANNHWPDNPTYNESRHTGDDVEVLGRVLDGTTPVEDYTIVVKLKKGSQTIADDVLQTNSQGEFTCTFTHPPGHFECGDYTIELWVQGVRMPFYSNSYQNGQNSLLALPFSMSDSGC